MATRKQYEAITMSIVNALQAGTAPWRKPWNAPAGNAFPHNAITGKRYRGLNVFSLWAVAAMKDYSSQAWLTKKQAVDAGGTVKAGERYQFIQFWKFSTRETGELDAKGKPIVTKSFIFNMYPVYNIEQCESLKLPKRELITDSPDDDFDAIAEAEAIASAYIANGGPSVDHNGGDRAYYQPSSHQVHIPKQSQFGNPEAYYSTLFHELAHSTGHKSLLGRFAEDAGPAHFGSDRYGREELVAEFTNAFLCAEVGIEDKTIDNNAAYIQNWLQAIQGDYTLALTAASRAQKASDLILAALADKLAASASQPIAN